MKQLECAEQDADSQVERALYESAINGNVMAQREWLSRHKDDCLAGETAIENDAQWIKKITAQRKQNSQ